MSKIEQISKEKEFLYKNERAIIKSWKRAGSTYYLKAKGTGERTSLTQNGTKRSSMPEGKPELT